MGEPSTNPDQIRLCVQDYIVDPFEVEFLSLIFDLTFKFGLEYEKPLTLPHLHTVVKSSLEEKGTET